MAALHEIAESIADVLSDLDVENLQVVPSRWWKPTPPTLDIYPDDPAQNEGGFGGASSELVWVVRARVGTIDEEGQQLLLLSLMEPVGPTSVRFALNDSDNLNSTVEGIHCERPTGYRMYRDTSALEFLGVQWRVRVYNDSSDVS